jgi:hypothetical protein
LSQISAKGFDMKKYKSLVIGGIFCCFFVMMIGCGTSELSEIWRDSSFQDLPLHKILVLSVSKNPVHRRIWEDAFCAALAKHEVAALPSYRLFPDSIPDAEQVAEIERSSGYDGVLITRWLPTETNKEYSQGYLVREQDTRYAWRRYGFVPYYRDVWHAGAIDSQKVDIRAIDVWATRNEGQMIWSATSKTPEPNAAQDVRPEIVKLVICELTKQGIIVGER